MKIRRSPLSTRHSFVLSKSGPRACTGRVLRIDPEEALVEWLIYESYIDSGSLLDVARQMNFLGHTTKRWTSTRGKTHVGNPM